MVIGGSLCQYEDNIQPYIDVVKTLYKEVISVSDHSPEQGDSPSLHVTSSVFKIYSAKNEEQHGCILQTQSGSQLPRDSNPPQELLFFKQQINNFLYLIVDPSKHLCYTLYHHVH